MASEELCSSELINNATDVVEPESAEQSRTEEFTSSSQLTNIQELYVIDSFVDVSDNVAVSAIVSVGSEVSVAQCEESDFSTSVLSTANTETCGSGCDDIPDERTKRIAAECIAVNEISQVLTTADEYGNLDFPNLKGLDPKDHRCEGGVSISLAPPIDIQRYLSSTSPTEQMECSLNNDVVIPLNNDVVIPLNNDVVIPLNNDVVIPLNNDVVIPLNNDVVIPSNNDVVIPLNNDVVIPLNNDVVIPLNNDVVIPSISKNVIAENFAPVEDDISTVIDHIGYFEVDPKQNELISLDLPEHDGPMGGVSYQHDGPMCGVSYEDNVTDSVGSLSGVWRNFQFEDISFRPVDSAKTEDCMPDNALPHQDKDTLSQSSEVCEAPLLIDICNNTRTLLSSVQNIGENELGNVSSAYNGSFIDIGIDLSNIGIDLSNIREENCNAITSVNEPKCETLVCIDVVESCVPPHSTDVVESYVPPPSTDVVESCVPPPSTDVVESGVPHPITDVVESGVPPPNTDVVESCVPPPSTDVVEPCVPPHSTDVVESGVPPPNTDVVESSVPPPNTDVVESGVPPPSTDVVESGVPPPSIDVVESCVPPPINERKSEVLPSTNRVEELDMLLPISVLQSDDALPPVSKIVYSSTLSEIGVVETSCFLSEVKTNTLPPKCEIGSEVLLSTSFSQEFNCEFSSGVKLEKDEASKAESNVLTENPKPKLSSESDGKGSFDFDIEDIPIMSIPGTLPTISERTDKEKGSGIDVIEEMEFNLLNSPMLRRSRQSIEEKTRRDCRFIFGEEGSDESEGNSKSFVALRDSLDIAKHVLYLENSDDELKSVHEKVMTASCSFESSSSDSSSAEWKPPPYQSNHSKAIAHKVKKTSIKGDKEKDANRRVSFPEDDSRLITSYLEPVNPWYHMNEVSTDIISEAYKKSCERHKTRALPVVLQQIVALPVDVGGRIECLSIRNQKLETGQCECLEEIFRRVQFHTLDFEACELDDDSAIPLFDMVEFYDSAIQLNISHNNKIGNRGWQACARMMKRTPSLRILEARNTSLSEQNMPIICKALRCGTRLHTLHLENCNLTGRPLVNLVGALRLNDTITDLYLADNRLGANDCIQLGNLVRANKTLKLLDLRNNNIQDSGCAHICKDIADQQSFRLMKGTDEDEEGNSIQFGLSTLVLWSNHITVHAIPYFSLMLHANQTIETLNLGRNNLTSEGVLLLKNSLMRNKTLKRLGLQSTRIGNEGAVALAECIADNNVISRIDLRENSIQVAGLLALCRSLKINSTVVQLDLDANPRAEPSQELSDQHMMLHLEIKELCQRNQTNDHLKNTPEPKEGKEENKNLLLTSPEKRKISLTCDTSNKNNEEKISEAVVNENKRYRSPAPSPSVSPCPSPSLSPSPSPVPSPMKNRFKVCKVAEEGGAFTSSFESSSPGAAMLSTSAPAFFMHSSITGSLPSLVPTSRPNRFTGGGRFTVTKVQENSSSAFKSSLPCSRAMSSPSLIVVSEDVVPPTIVVSSSPNKAVRGFCINASEEDVCFSANHDLKRNNSLDLPSIGNRTSSSSSDSNSPQDDVFIEEDTNVTGNTGSSSTKYTSNINRPPTPGSTHIQRAPLASIEAGSFDSDSEDSELTTQSSDSTHSDEVKIATEQTSPLSAWEEKGSDRASTKSFTGLLANED